MHKTPVSNWRQKVTGDTEPLSRLLQLLGDTTRLALLREIDRGKGTLGVTTLRDRLEDNHGIDRAIASISASLLAAELQGVVEKKKQGREVYYSIASDFKEALEPIGGLKALFRKSAQHDLLQILSAFANEHRPSSQHVHVI